MSFFGELRRRNVFRVGIAYLAAVWVLIEVADTLVSIINAPAWIPQVLVYSAALGFPLVLVLAWFYELTPDGIKATADVEAVEAVEFTGRKIDFAIIGLLVIAVGFLLVRSPLDDQITVLPNSVAVLPFDNLSPGADDAYFATGLHDEILSQLTKLSNLTVISRTSVLRYADSELSIPEIARELNVRTVMEGTVRYDDNRVRITTQLIDAETDGHLWSETYEREFSDIFSIESDIAINVANALAAEFSFVEQQSIEKIPTHSLAAYRLYLAAVDLRGDLADELLDQATLLDPDFALAYAEKASRLTLRLVGVGDGASPVEALELERTIRENVERALDLDPALAQAHAALGVVHQANWQGDVAEQAFQRAYELAPNDVQILVAYGRFKRYRAEYAEAISLKQRAAALAPNEARPIIQLALTHRFAGNWDDVVTVNRQLIDSRGFADYFGLAMAEVARGNLDEAVAALRTSEEQDEPSVFTLAQWAQAYAQAGRPDEARRVFADIEEAAEAQPIGQAIWARAYIAIGEYGEALRSLELATTNRVPTDFAALAELAANPWNDSELASPPFRALLDELWEDG